MAYSDFTLSSVQQQFNLRLNEQTRLFPNLAPVPISSLLRATLDENIPLALAIHTEKARSELLITPIVLEVRRLCERQISLFSGLNFPVDPAAGLHGVCDYVLARSPEQLFLTAPAVIIIEAKNDNIKAGLGQCIAAMLAAHQFNQHNHQPIPTVYGTVTTGTSWRLLALHPTPPPITVQLDQHEYHINQVEEIVAALAYAASGTPIATAAPEPVA